jgi:hypothetical protein
MYCWLYCRSDLLYMCVDRKIYPLHTFCALVLLPGISGSRSARHVASGPRAATPYDIPVAWSLISPGASSSVKPLSGVPSQKIRTIIEYLYSVSPLSQFPKPHDDFE